MAEQHSCSIVNGLVYFTDGAIENLKQVGHGTSLHAFFGILV